MRSEGSYADVIRWNTANFVRWHSNVQGQFAILPEEFLMFLLGFLAGRRRLFDDTARNRSLLRKTVWWTVFIVILAHLISPQIQQLEESPVHGHLGATARLIVADVRLAAHSIFYAAAATLLLTRLGLVARLARMGALGRMALTNYLLLSVVVTTLFYDYGFGLYGNVTPVQGVAMAIAASVLMMLGSSWWLNRYRFGPAEWVWRSLTYGNRQPMKRNVIRDPS